MKQKICPYCKTRVEYNDPKRAIVCPSCLAIIREDKRATANEGKCENYISESLEYVATGDMVKAFEWAIKATMIDSKNARAKELKKNCASYLSTACKSYSEQKDPQSQFNDYFNRAHKCFLKKDYSSALGYISLALEINPDDKNAKSCRNSIESMLKMQSSSKGLKQKSYNHTAQNTKTEHEGRIEKKSEQISSVQSCGFIKGIIDKVAVWWPLILISLVGLGFWAYYFPISFMIVLLIVLIPIIIDMTPD